MRLGCYLIVSLNKLVVSVKTFIECGHFFHEDCITKWFSRSNKCPVCRYEYPHEYKSMNEDPTNEYPIDEDPVFGIA